MKAAVYLRQSLDRDGTGAAVDRQRQDCRKLCSERRWQVAGEYVDNDTSATSTKPRPAYVRMLSAVERGEVDVIVAWHVDRLTRRLIELEHLIDLAAKYDVKVATVTGDLDLGTDQGRLVGRILASVARGEVERKGARQRRAQQQAAAQGRPPGGRRAFGYEPDGATVRPGEAREVRKAYRTVLAGGSLRGIAADWNTRGIATTMGGRWDHSTVRGMLVNPRNAGLRSYRGEVVGPGAWKPLVPEDTWKAVTVKLSDPGRRTTTAAPARLYLLPGLARCYCGETTVATGRTQHGIRTYRCRERKGHMSRAAEPVDRFVGGLVVERLRRPDARQLLERDTSPNLDEHRERVAALRVQLDELATALAEGLLPLDAVRRESDRLRRQISDAETQMHDVDRAAILGDIVDTRDVESAWSRLDLDRRRAVIDCLMTVTLLAPGRGRKAFDPATVDIEWKA
jgi:site-specific DNA recombinase